MNLKNPATFNEKILTRKKLDLKLKAQYSDKIELSKMLNFSNVKVRTPEILRIFNQASELSSFNFSEFGKSGFVMKANHGSGMNILYFKGQIPSMDDLKRVSNWFSYDSSINSRENHYNLIEKRVFIEQLLDDNINDYKFHCFNGKVEVIQVDVDRFINHRRNMYSRDWILQDFEINYKKSDKVLEIPEKLAEMISIAEQIAALNCFNDYIRVDLYENKSMIYIGELTFHPGGGVEPFDCYESDLKMGLFFKN